MCLCLSPRPVKSPLKVQNGVQEADSPIKKVAKRSRQILDSDDDEAPVVKEQVATKGQGDKEAPSKTEKVEMHCTLLNLDIKVNLKHYIQHIHWIFFVAFL